MRLTITRFLNDSPGIQVVATAHDGQEALDLIPRLTPDVVTLDVEMPHLDGLTTLRAIMTQCPRPVIMLSSLTTEGALETIQALTLGAVDFVGKPNNKANVTAVMEEVVEKIRRAATARIRPALIARPAPPAEKTGPRHKADPHPAQTGSRRGDRFVHRRPARFEPGHSRSAGQPAAQPSWWSSICRSALPAH